MKGFPSNKDAKIQNWTTHPGLMNKDGNAVRYAQNLRTTYLSSWTVPYQRTVLQFNF